MKKFIAILMQLTTLATAQVPYYIQGTSGGKTGLVSMLDISGSSVTTATFTNIGGVRTLRLVLTGSGGGGVSSNDCVLIVNALAYPLTSNPSNYVRAAQLGSAAYADLSAFAPSTVTNVDLSGYVGLAGFIGATNTIAGRIVTIEGKTNTWNGIVNTITVNGVAGSLSSNLNFSVTTGTPMRDDGVGYVTVTMANGTNVVGLTGEAIRSACAEYIATNRYLRADQTTNLVNEIVSPVAVLASNAYDTSIINSNAIGGMASTNGTYLLMSVGTATTASTANSVTGAVFATSGNVITNGQSVTIGSLVATNYDTTFTLTGSSASWPIYGWPTSGMPSNMVLHFTWLQSADAVTVRFLSFYCSTNAPYGGWLSSGINAGTSIGGWTSANPSWGYMLVNTNGLAPSAGVDIWAWCSDWNVATNHKWQSKAQVWGNPQVSQNVFSIGSGIWTNSVAAQTPISAILIQGNSGNIVTGQVRVFFCNEIPPWCSK
jgi:hypothetical protein